MNDSSPSKRRRRNTSGSISLERGSSDDFFLRSEDMLAPLRSEDVLLGGGLDARTSGDIVEDILLPDPVATAAAAVAADAGEKSQGPDRAEKIGKLRAKLERNAQQRVSSRDWIGDFEGESVGLGPIDPSLFGGNARISSRDWIRDFEGESVGLDLDPSLFDAACRDAMAEQLTAPPLPLSNPLASNVACPSFKKPTNAPSAASAAKTDAPPSASAATKNTKKKSRKPSRKRRFDETAVVEPSAGDVLSGRGGFANNHPGNIRFREKAFELRPRYRESSKEEKQEIADLLVDFVRSKGNRFLGKGKDGRWHEMIGNGPHNKASQALRERIRGGNGD